MGATGRPTPVDMIAHMSKPLALPPTEAELEEIARFHFTYEVFALIDVLGKGIAGTPPPGRLLANGIPGHALGSHDLLLHTRLLANVIRCSDDTCPRFHNDDIEARHFISGWAGVDILAGDRERVDKALAHLSRQRLSLGRIPGKDRHEMATRVLRAILEFIKALPEARRSWFDQAEAAIRSALV